MQIGQKTRALRTVAPRDRENSEIMPLLIIARFSGMSSADGSEGGAAGWTQPRGDPPSPGAEEAAAAHLSELRLEEVRDIKARWRAFVLPINSSSSIGKHRFGTDRGRFENYTKRSQ